MSPALISRMALLTSMPLMAACNGVSWPSERIVRSLRVLAVQAEPASVTPGQNSQLSLLCADGIGGPTADTHCNVEVAWFGACDNPPKNDPTKCLSQYAGWLDQISPVLADHTLSSTSAPFQVAQKFQYQAPDDVLQNQVTVGGQTIQYGNSYVYFAVCAGKLVPAAGLTDQLPVQCRDSSSNVLLDQRRFVVGVTTLYAYDKILNHNPQFPVPSTNMGQQQLASAVPYAGKACTVDSDCYLGPTGTAVGGVSGAGGVSPASACASNGASNGVCAPLMQRCNKNVPGSCDVHDVGAEVAASSFVLTGLDGTVILNPLKSLWIDCYANAGAWPDDPRHGIGPPIVNDVSTSNISAYLKVLSAMTGCGSGWQAPPQPTDQARIWVVLRDDRGGIAWREQRVVVR
jgi:hypothetical protein